MGLAMPAAAGSAVAAATAPGAPPPFEGVEATARPPKGSPFSGGALDDLFAGAAHTGAAAAVWTSESLECSHAEKMSRFRV